jgi:hypothetical protein
MSLSLAVYNIFGPEDNEDNENGNGNIFIPVHQMTLLRFTVAGTFFFANINR